MNAKHLEKLKKLIVDTIKILSARDYDFNVDERGDEVDAAQGGFIVGMMHDQRNRSNARLAELNEALLKIKGGIYGLCEECDEEISIKRLEICPEARCCIRCAEVLEREKKGYFTR